MLKIENLHVEIKGREILHGISLEVPDGEVHALLGPNGSGKSTLLMAAMGFSGYAVTKGRVLLDGKDITHIPINERARAGLGIAFQRPPIVKGIKTKHLVAICMNNGKIPGQDTSMRKDVEILAEDMHCRPFLDRELNSGLSGGEMKRSELMQLLAQDPRMVLLDEPESGVDIENIALLGKAINRLLGRNPEPNGKESLKEKRIQRRRSALIITHTGHILNYLFSDRGYVMIDGYIACEGNPRELLGTVEKYGYKECLKCVV
ncbi:MAG: ABC transporter ATP-binding protein [Deltaproteobacteria bacterium]|nr:ABC transporter ATP-binding protein [Deltaproteobacteria bacterium]